MNGKVLTFIVLIVAMTLAACGSGVAGGQESTGSVDGEWTLLTLNGAALLPDTTINAAFADGYVTGFSGCNSYFGSYAVDGSAIHFEQLGMTLMACLEQGVMDQEQAYTEALSNVAQYHLADDRLELLDKSGAALLVYARQEVFEGDPAALLGVEWQLVTFDGSPLDEAMPFTLAFADSRYSGLAGCRHFEGDYQAGDGDIQFPSIIMVETECPGAGDAYYAQEGRFTDALTWARQWRIADGQLEIHTARGEVLVFAPRAPMPGGALDGTAWSLTAFIEGEALPALVAETEITLYFDAGQARGSAGCNSYGGAYTLERGVLRFDGIAITEMYCMTPEGVMEQETRYAGILGNVTLVEWDADQLTLRTADGRGLVFTAFRE